MEMRRDLAVKQAKLCIIDAMQILAKSGLGKCINMIMQSVFFMLSRVMPYEEVLELFKRLALQAASAFQFKTLSARAACCYRRVAFTGRCCIIARFNIIKYQTEMRKNFNHMYGEKGNAVVKMTIDGMDVSVGGIAEYLVPSSWACLQAEVEESKGVQSHSNNLDGSPLPVSTFFPAGPVLLGTRHGDIAANELPVKLSKEASSTCFTLSYTKAESTCLVTNASFLELAGVLVCNLLFGRGTFGRTRYLNDLWSHRGGVPAFLPPLVRVSKVCGMG